MTEPIILPLAQSRGVTKLRGRHFKKLVWISVHHAFLVACFTRHYHVWGPQVKCQSTQRMAQPRMLFILRHYIKYLLHASNH